MHLLCLSALEKRYLERIDKLVLGEHAYRYGYTTKIKKRDMSLFEKKYVVTHTTLYTNYFLLKDKDR
jgi:hypothetical protein